MTIQATNPRHMQRFLPGFILALSLILWACCVNAQDKQTQNTAPIFEHNFITLEKFEDLRQQGAAILDARTPAEFNKSHIPGAANTPWEAFVDGDQTGEVSPDDARLTQLLRNAGVHQNQPVLIYGNWSDKSAWGEEGRILWTLQYLGKKDVFILQDGFKGWKTTNQPTNTIKKAKTGDFSIKRQENLRISTQDLQTLIAQNPDNLVILDTRERIEYHGIPKYGESRGGHIPGAKHMWWYDVFARDGNLKSKAQLTALFSKRGISKGTHIIVYCTGGVRSGFVFTVLQALGYKNIQNYDASMWEWSAQKDKPLNRIKQ